MLMCQFAVDLGALRAEFGDFVSLLASACRRARDLYAGHVGFDGEALSIDRDGPLLARLVAQVFDAQSSPAEHYSLAV
jgi:coproporphyrinogen III oxidase-like Fe-S oxidoreductase